MEGNGRGLLYAIMLSPRKHLKQASPEYAKQELPAAAHYRFKAQWSPYVPRA
jgi:hypothetical protein